MLLRLALLLTVAVSGPAFAGVVTGVVRLPGKFEAVPQFTEPGHWRIPNNVIKLLPPLLSPTASMVVALDGLSTRRAGPDPAFHLADYRFTPPVLAVRPGTTVKFQNNDPQLHLLEAKGLFSGKNIGPGDPFSYKFSKAGEYKIRCSEVPHMVATVLVTNKNAVALPNARGEFRFQSIPNGSYTLRVWYAGKWIHSQPVTVRGGRTNVQVQLLPQVKD